MAAILGLVAAVAAALITRSVMISNHRQAWINGLREDLATFFTAVDAIYLGEATCDDGETKQGIGARNSALLAYRKILMRLNMSEPLHNQLEKSLASLLVVRADTANQDDLAAAVTLARTILKKEWEVTKYGTFTEPVTRFKKWCHRKGPPAN